MSSNNCELLAYYHPDGSDGVVNLGRLTSDDEERLHLALVDRRVAHVMFHTLRGETCVALICHRNDRRAFDDARASVEARESKAPAAVVVIDVASQT